MIENNYDLPHHEFVPSKATKMIISLAKKLSENTKLPIGVSTLWNDYKTSLKVCKLANATFFRVPAFVDSVKTSYGIMKKRAEEVTSLRKKMGLQNVAILADIQVKHSVMIDKSKSLSQSVKEAIDAGADALIITGKWTGNAPKTNDLKIARKTANNFPILIGSGATKKNLKTLLKYVDGIIVGTAIKEGQSVSKENEINLKPHQATISLKKTTKFVDEFKKIILQDKTHKSYSKYPTTKSKRK